MFYSPARVDSEVLSRLIIALILIGACVLCHLAPVFVITSGGGMPGRREGAGTRHSLEMIHHG